MNEQMPGEAHESEFGVVAGWTAEALVDRDPISTMAGACRGSGSPTALAWLAESLRLEPDAVLLDIGAGLGGASAWAAEHYGVRPIGVDPMHEAARGMRRLFPIPAMTASVTSLPFRTASVRRAWMLGVLDTLEHPDIGMSEIRRVLGREGRLGILAYIANEPLDPAMVPDGNYFQSIASLEAMVQQAGFVVVDRVHGQPLPAPPLDWQRRQDQLEAELERLHRRDALWAMAADQQRSFARLLDSGAVSLALLHALRV